MRGRLGALSAGVLMVAGLTAGANTSAVGATTDGARHPADGPPTITADDVRFNPHTTLRRGSPREAGLLPGPIERIMPDAAAYLEPTPDHPTYPMYAGAVVIAARNGVIVEHGAVGQALKYGVEDGEVVELPADEQVPMRDDTIFDLASVSKLFTTVAAVQQVEEGLVDLDAPVVRYIPEFGQNGKESVTVRQLLTHTSGMPAWRPIYREATYEERIAAVYETPLDAPPQTRYTYSDLNLITLGKIIEKVTGKGLDEAVRDGITEPLGMVDTGYNPPAAELGRVAATEYQPWTRPAIIRGEVHDENAWSLNGVAGHAGVFSTARDLAIFAQTLLNGGRYGKARILSPDSVRALMRNLNEEFRQGAARGLGFQLDQHWYMGPLSSPVTYGHTGYTGTSMVVDPLTQSFVIMLTNRVHPSRDWNFNSLARHRIAQDLGLALPVRPAVGRTAWFSGLRDATTTTLTGALDEPAEGARISFRVWYDTEWTWDTASLWASTDGGQSWTVVPLNLRAGRHQWTAEELNGFSGRQWAWARAELPDGTTHVRWSYDADRRYQGRGVYVDGVWVLSRQGLLLSSELRRHEDRFASDGWSRAST